MNALPDTSSPLTSPFRAVWLAAAIATAAHAQTEYANQSLGYHLGRHVALSSTHLPVSVDAAGDLGDSRWSAVWQANAEGVVWDAAYGLDYNDFWSWRNSKTSQGYRMKWITASGAGTQAVFGGVMVQDNRSAHAVHAISDASLSTQIELMHDQNRIPVCFSAYGTSTDRRYAFVFEENVDNLRWGACFDKTGAEFQAQFTTFTQQCWARPRFVTRSAWGTYYGFFTDDPVGQWGAHHGLTKAQYDVQVNTFSAQGYRALHTDVSGPEVDPRFCVIFRRGTPSPMQFHRTGTFIPELQQVDDNLTADNGGFLREHNIRQAAVAVVKHGKLVFARAYTYAPQGHPIAQPTTRFRTASVSKSITAIAAYHMFDNDPTVQPGSRLTQVMPIPSPLDPRAHDIRIRHLINHSSGYVSSWYGVQHRVGHILDTFQNDMLDHAPGHGEVYANGMQVLAGVLEHQSGMSFPQYLQQNVFDPVQVLGAHQMKPAPWPGDARFHEAAWSGSRRLRVARSPSLPGNPLVNAAHDMTETGIDASGGLVASAVEVARIVSGAFDRKVDGGILSTLAKVALEIEIERPGRTGGFDGASQLTLPNGETIMRYTKGGLWNSARAALIRRSDGVTIVSMATGPKNLGTWDNIESVINGIAASDWPQTDLWEDYGFPPFETAQGEQGHTSPFGFGCLEGCEHEGFSIPTIGGSHEFGIVGAPGNHIAVGLLGYSNSSWSGATLPLDLSPFGAAGCELYVSPDDTVVGITDPAGDLGMSLTIPNDPRFVGLALFTQFVLLVPDHNALGLAYTNGLMAVVGE